MSGAEVDLLAARLTVRPALALTRWPDGAHLKWTEACELAREPNDRMSMAFKRVVQPLIDRGLAEESSPSSYDRTTEVFTWGLYALTPLGLAVRAHLQGQPS